MKNMITVALIYDFDGTLAPGNMQEYDFIPAVGKSNMESQNSHGHIRVHLMAYLTNIKMHCLV